MIFIKNSNENMEKLIEKEKQLRKIQENYYHTLLEKEENTKCFRHDITNHLVCLSELIADNNIEGVIKYIEDMEYKFLRVKKNDYKTGNEILDIITNYYMQMLDEDVKIIITGKCINHVEIDDVDMCIIFANLIQNAVEAINNEEIDNKYLEINIMQGKEYLQVQIINTIGSDCKLEENFRTKKLDKKNHGFGLKNVYDTVKKNDGVLNIEIEKGSFIVSVVIKNKRLMTNNQVK